MRSLTEKAQTVSNMILRKLIFRNEGVIPMWVADMDFKTPDFIINAIHERLEHEILGYTCIPASFYDSIVQWNQRRHHWKIKPEWISFAPGVVPALSLLVMAFTNPGDGIIIQPPVYFPFFSAVKNHDRKLIINPLRYENGSYSMDFDDLEASIEDNTRMLFLCSPHNPTGNVWSSETLEQLGEICLRAQYYLSFRMRSMPIWYTRVTDIFPRQASPKKLPPIQLPVCHPVKHLTWPVCLLPIWSFPIQNSGHDMRRCWTRYMWVQEIFLDLWLRGCLYIW